MNNNESIPYKKKVLPVLIKVNKHHFFGILAINHIDAPLEKNVYEDSYRAGFRHNIKKRGSLTGPVFYHAHW